MFSCFAASRNPSAPAAVALDTNKMQLISCIYKRVTGLCAQQRRRGICLPNHIQKRGLHLLEQNSHSLCMSHGLFKYYKIPRLRPFVPLGIRPFPCLFALVSLCSISFATPLCRNTPRPTFSNHNVPDYTREGMHLSGRDYPLTQSRIGKRCVTAKRKDRRKAEEKTTKEGEHLD